MLWDIIRDFFVQYIWGGFTSQGVLYSGMLGGLTAIGNSGTEDYLLSANDQPLLKIFSGMVPDIFNGNVAIEEGSIYIGFGDWLSTTSTIIVLILMCVFLYVFIRWAFRLTAGLFQGR